VPADSMEQAHATEARPLFIPHGDAVLFAWQHPAHAARRRHAAIVLCPPLGFDYVCVYQTWRILAERLAACGFDVFRFDYEGTGESTGDPAEPNRGDAWLRSVDRVIEEARAATGNRALALVGLRFGAMLAARAAATLGTVDRLVLWSGFRSGRAFVRELKAFTQISRQDHAAEPTGEATLCAGGHILTEDTAAAIHDWRIEQLPARPAPEILIVERDDRPAEAELLQSLEQLGAHVTTVRPEGTAAMLTQPALSTVPEQALEAITGWFEGWHAGAAVQGQTAASASHTSVPASRGDEREYCERPVRFGPDGRLFGIVTVPRRAIPGRPTIVLVNTGSEYRIGPSRLYVPLARQWAADGHHVFRYDLGGIGDSAPPPGADENVVYPTHIVDDLRHAIVQVLREAPGAPVIVIGLCSGGWLAFLAAREQLPVRAIVSVNPPLYLRDGDLGSQRLAEYDELGRYRRSMREPARWMKAFTGRAAYGTFIRVALASLQRLRLSIASRTPGRQLVGLADDLHQIRARGVSSLFVFSEGDWGLRYFQIYAAAAIRDRRGLAPLQHVIVDGAGHTFRPPAAQRAFRDLVVEFVRRQTDLPAGPRSS
jgi:alpha-beta hydrolase superfamily lysophospholipase